MAPVLSLKLILSSYCDVSRSCSHQPQLLKAVAPDPHPKKSWTHASWSFSFSTQLSYPLQRSAAVDLWVWRIPSHITHRSVSWGSSARRSKPRSTCLFLDSLLAALHLTVRFLWRVLLFPWLPCRFASESSAKRFSFATRLNFELKAF